MARSMLARAPITLVENVFNARHGSDRAMTDLVQACLPDLEGYLARRGARHPEALANQVMAEFTRSLHRLHFDTDQQIWGYVHHIARSRLIDERRKSRPEETPLEHVEIEDRHQSSFDERIATKLAVNSLIADLTTEQRQVIELRFMQDLSISETARRLGKSVTAVKGLQHRAIAALAAAAALIALLVAVSQMRGDNSTYIEIEPTRNDSEQVRRASSGESDRTRSSQPAGDDRLNSMLVLDGDRPSQGEDRLSIDEQIPLLQDPLPSGPASTTAQGSATAAIEATAASIAADSSPQIGADVVQGEGGEEGSGGWNGGDGESGSPATVGTGSDTQTASAPTTTVVAPSTTNPSSSTSWADAANQTLSRQMVIPSATTLTEIAVPLGPDATSISLDPDTFTVWDAPANGGLRFDNSTAWPTLYFVIPPVRTQEFAGYSICASDGICYRTVLEITYG